MKTQYFCLNNTICSSKTTSEEKNVLFWQYSDAKEYSAKPERNVFPFISWKILTNA